MIRKILPTFFLLITLLSGFIINPSISRAQDVPSIFEPEPGARLIDKGRSLAKCAEGWRQFLSASIGFEGLSGIADYFFDFLRWPSHYADIAIIQNQLNKARYAVMATFFRCDLDRLKSVTDAYYKLEAELYFVRNFVDTDGGYARILTEQRGSREQFKKDFVDKMEGFYILRDEGPSKEEYRGVLEGYFDLFEAKYRTRGQRYKNPEGDPIFNQLDEKIQNLISTLESFSDLGKQFAGLGEEIFEAGKDAVVKVKDTGVKLYESPGKTLWDGVKSVNSMFTVCPASGNPDDCKTFTEALGAVVSEGVDIGTAILKTAGTVISQTTQTIVGIGKSTGEFVADLLSSPNAPKLTYGDLSGALERIDLIQKEGDIQGEMRSRYELLYGTVAASGLSDVISEMDRILDNLRTKSQGSLTAIKTCAARVLKRVCK